VLFVFVASASQQSSDIGDTTELGTSMRKGSKPIRIPFLKVSIRPENTCSSQNQIALRHLGVKRGQFWLTQCSERNPVTKSMDLHSHNLSTHANKHPGFFLLGATGMPATKSVLKTGLEPGMPLSLRGQRLIPRIDDKSKAGKQGWG
jgi:hypothetical protein